LCLWVYFPEREKGAQKTRLFCHISPNGKMNSKPIADSDQLGARIRARRTELGLTQGELADVSAVTLRFVSELENGKETAQFAGIQRVLASLGLELHLESR
jgi:HTH-type transcriptional regulator/antitoxin HipB